MSSQCDICSEIFSKKYLLILHNRVHYDGISCLLCKCSFENKSQFSDHLKTHIARQSKIPQPFQCGVCLKIFQKEDELSIHFENHINGTQKFEELSNNNIASKTSKVTSFTCKICDKSYLRLDLCKQHVTKHVSNLECNLCGKAFSKYEHLVNHTRTHTGELLLQCSQCSKSFYKNEHLSRHLRTHSKETPYKCNICMKSFCRKDNLQRHIRSHSTSSVECTICRKQIKSEGYLRTHMRSHKNIRKFKCIECESSFATAANLEFHKKTHKTEITLELEIHSL